MSQLTTLARPYAKAAFEVALSGKSLSSWSAMLDLLGAVARHETVARYLSSPSLSAQQQAATIIELCGDELNVQAQNFLNLLAENKRLLLLPEIHRLFEELKASQEKTIDVEVTTAFALSGSAQENLAQSLKIRLQREVNINTHIDKRLIGGLVVRAGDLVIDGSVRGRLNKLAEAMNS